MPTESALSERFEMRASRQWIASVDNWRRAQPDLPSRGEAIRRLVELGIGRGVSASPVAKPDASARASRRSQAEKIAAEQIDRVLKNVDQPEEVKDKRKRRLTKGPAEFRKP